ncbi:UDP-glucose 4-epimerase [Vibrio cholerae]|uniref:NAD-dependent epimerase/dehydratase family protein n=1 Tax=Vibrio cholerae TaxID=666 RepID=UPI00096BC72E|nr:NAD-dependent epimerase/dehydratase family protein [Vibrio cholerae]MBO1385605.1 UDP-glucose 4-epimerase [Vibrio cholerae]WOQ90043.1 NAD-dependent epimerase/dehydratase family protein [Vibrio cholerae]
MNLLLTGASGFIGGYLIDYLNERPHFNCTILSRSHIELVDNILNVDLLSDFDLRDVLRAQDAVIHIAAMTNANEVGDKVELFKMNVDATLRLAEQSASAGVKRFVFVSSIGVNGTSTSDKPFTSHGKVQPHNAYAQSKYEAELGLKKIAEETRLEVVIVRPTLVYGLNAPGKFGMLTKLVKKLPVLPFCLANNRRDFISVQNLADLLITCATHPEAAGHTFLPSDGETVSIKQFTNAIAKGLGKKVFQLPVPVALMRLAGKLVGKSDMIEQLYGNLEVDSSNIKEVLGWTPPYTMEQSMALLKHTDK